MTIYDSGADGELTEAARAFWRDRFTGFSVFIMPFTNVAPGGIGFEFPNAFDQRHLETLREYADIAHEQGALVLAQLAHSGLRADDWGGSRDRRMAFSLAVVDAVDAVRREHGRPDFILGYRFSPEEPGERGLTMADTFALVVAITGIHGNFFTNPFYVTFGRTLNRTGTDLVYARTNDAFNEIPGTNVRTGQEEVIGSWNEDFADTDEDVQAWLDYAESADYRRIILAGHSLGANKVIYYLSRHHDPRVEHFLLLSPANLRHLTNQVTPRERQVVRDYVERGQGQRRLPFPLMGWVPCRAETARQWLFDNVLDNVRVEADGDFSQVAAMRHTGAMLIGTCDRFTYGDPAGFLTTINDHTADPHANELVLIKGTGHTYQGKDQEVAEVVARLVCSWEKEGATAGG